MDEAHNCTNVANSTITTESNMTSNVSAPSAAIHARDGYDLPLYGIDNGMFYYIHIPALVCISASFVCSVIAITLSFRTLGCKQFFTKWKSSEKFVVYLAVCDGLFNLAHFADHAQIAVTKEHVYPRELCIAFGFVIGEFIAAQLLIVNMIAINVFMLLYFNKHLNYGRWDWRFLLWTFGAPLLGVTIAAILGHFGPTGSFCFFDRVRGTASNTVFSVSPVAILILNIVLYLLSWIKVSQQVKGIKRSLKMSPSLRASLKAARVMSLFVVALVVQWWAVAVFGVWSLVVEQVPEAIHHIVTVFTNIGGVLNLIVYTILRKQH